MKKVEAIIRPSKLDEVKESLGKFGVNGLTVTEVVGCGQQKGHTQVYRGVEYKINLLPKVKVEVVIQAEHTAEVIRLISAAARTGEIGDGKIFISSIENAVKIRTGEIGESAL